MIDLLRQEVMSAARTIVVKVGSNVLTGADGTLDRARVAHLADQLAGLAAEGRQVALVSSGAVAAGVGKLRLPGRPAELAALQAAAAVGQSDLIRAYDDALRPHGRAAAQLLLTAGDFEDRTRYLNVHHTLRQLFEWQAIPIINENDTVSVAELKFTDNDQLAALVTCMLRAPLLVILSVAEGLYAGDPAATPGLKPLTTVMQLDDAAFGLVRTSKSAFGTGGMRSKLMAVRQATTAGENVVIASGREPEVLRRLLAGEPLGTLFPATGDRLTAWKRWLGFATRPKGAYVVDAGAKAALASRGGSLLPVGIQEVRGEFQPGEVVGLECPAGQEFARGLTNYSAEEAVKVRGLPTAKLAAALPGGTHAEAVHRDNLALLE
jgi:glutamate 5-kinase